MSVKPTDRPDIDASAAGRLAVAYFGLEATVGELPSERDRNFLLSQGDTRYVLKIANAGESEAVLDLQNRAMVHLASQLARPVCPRPIPGATGNFITQIEAKDGRSHLVRLLTYLPGKPLSLFRPHSRALLEDLGRLLADVDKALVDFSHPAMTRNLYWDLKHARGILTEHVPALGDRKRMAIVDHFRQGFVKRLWPNKADLRESLVHGDANDFNVLVGQEGMAAARVTGLIDFGDMVHTFLLAELAVACAYVMLNKGDPLSAAAHVVRGYHQALPLREGELSLLFDLICARLCMSVVLGAHQGRQAPDNDYLSISQQAVWSLLTQLQSLSPELAHATFRHACGLEASPGRERVVNWLKSNRDKIGPILTADLRDDTPLVFDLSVGSSMLGELADRNDTAAFTRLLFGEMARSGTRLGIGRYDEARQIYAGDIFRVAGNDRPEWRTVHLGLDLFVAAETVLIAPIDGVVHSFANNASRLDYGPTIILRHDVADDLTFYTLYGHLTEESLEGLYPGKRFRKGERLARIGDFPINGDWPPHVHFQVITDMLGQAGEFPGVAAPGQRPIWLSLSPDPNLIINIPDRCFPVRPKSAPQILNMRRRYLGPSLSVSYQKPLKIVRGQGQYLYDEEGRAYLDAVNNVPHVGHCHPRVVRAARQQQAVLNTNTRYLHDSIVDYAQRLCATLPDPLNVCFFVCSGSEANELALRLARTHTGSRDIVVVDGAYHGNTSSLIDLSPYKFDGPGGGGATDHVHKVLMPDCYRGPYRDTGSECGRRYGAHVAEVLNELAEQGRRPAAFFCESMLGCGGQIVLPEGYLLRAYDLVRSAGGVCVADEVQVGFGRTGTHFWAFEHQGVVPDILTLGKPMGNGHPLAAVVTTPAIAASFDNGMEYFNTFGGNPVSCAIGQAVLDVIEDESLQQNALVVGRHLKTGLEQLGATHALVGDVRGLGLYLGIELVLDRSTLEPAPEQAAYVVERMRDHGILISTDGPLRNVLKIKPPLVFSAENADFLVAVLDQILAEDALQIA